MEDVLDIESKIEFIWQRLQVVDRQDEKNYENYEKSALGLLIILEPLINKFDINE